MLQSWRLPTVCSSRTHPGPMFWNCEAAVPCWIGTLGQTYSFEQAMAKTRLKMSEFKCTEKYGTFSPKYCHFITFVRVSDFDGFRFFFVKKTSGGRFRIHFRIRIPSVPNCTIRISRSYHVRITFVSLSYHFRITFVSRIRIL